MAYATKESLLRQSSDVKSGIVYYKPARIYLKVSLRI